MPINSRQKGAEFERKLAKLFREYGYEDSRRGCQFNGMNGDADVVGLDGVHVEAKAVENLSIYKAMEQSKRDAREGEMPVVIHKKNYKEILVTMQFDTFMKLYQKGHNDENI